MQTPAFLIRARFYA